MTKRKWRVVDARAPLAGRRDGRIEAVARTAIMGFRDDVVIRIRPDPDGARIDIRSTSRYGRHDFGTNAARVRLALGGDRRSGRQHGRRRRRPTPIKKAKKADPKALKTRPNDKRR